VYQVTYVDSAGMQRVEYLTAATAGTLHVGGCEAPDEDPILLPPNSPPDCTRARPSLAKLAVGPQDFVDVSIEGVTDPDEDPVFLTVDSVLQNEGTGGLFTGDLTPDAQIPAGSVARLRAERNPNGSGRVYTINFTATQPQGGFCQNAVTVCVPLIIGGDCANGTPLFDSTKKPQIDLSLTLTDSPDPVDRGEEITYSVTITNNSSLIASGVTLTDQLPFPNAADFVSSTLACQRDNDTVSCSVGNLGPRETRTANFVLRALAGGVITNRVNVNSFDSIDPDTTNNNATATTAVELNIDADLVVAIFDNPDPVVRGQAVTYTVTVLNRGPATATGVVLTQLLPAIEVIGSSIVVSQGTFTRQPRDGTITVNFGSLAPNASATLIFSGFTSSVGSTSTTATVTGNELDLTPANNSVTEFTTVNAQ